MCRLPSRPPPVWRTIDCLCCFLQELLPLFGEIAPGLANVWSSVAIRLLQRAVARLLEPVG